MEIIIWGIPIINTSTSLQSFKIQNKNGRNIESIGQQVMIIPSAFYLHSEKATPGRILIKQRIGSLAKVQISNVTDSEVTPLKKIKLNMDIPIAPEETAKIHNIFVRLFPRLAMNRSNIAPERCPTII